jgi:Zn-finger nucleic acid-binding protein
MHWITVGGTDLLECDGCDGTWLEAATFERLCADREAQAAIVHTATDSGDAAPRPLAPVRYRPCPRCSKLMNRVNFGRLSGAIVDVCKGHGTFLDRGELHQVIRFIQTGGMERTREAQREELKDEQRRLRERERDRARVSPDPASTRWNELMLSDLLGGLFDK